MALRQFLRLFYVILCQFTPQIFENIKLRFSISNSMSKLAIKPNFGKIGAKLPELCLIPCFYSIDLKQPATVGTIGSYRITIGSYRFYRFNRFFGLKLKLIFQFNLGPVPIYFQYSIIKVELVRPEFFAVFRKCVYNIQSLAIFC